MRTKKLAVIAGFTAIAMFGAVQPASAQSAVVAVFAGKAKLASPIGYPGLGINKGATIPFTAWAGTKAKAGDPTPSACASVKVSNPAAKAGKGVSGSGADATTACGVNAGGTVAPGPVLGLGPWCGHSAGTFNATISGTGLSGQSQTVNATATWVSAGSLLVITGTGTSGQQTGPFVALVSAVPNPAKGASCASGATNFFFTGVSAIVKSGGSKA